MGLFWSGCAGAVKRGLEILGIGVIDVDLHECMMLKAIQTTLAKDKENNDMSLYDWYAKALSDNKQNTTTYYKCSCRRLCIFKEAIYRQYASLLLPYTSRQGLPASNEHSTYLFPTSTDDFPV